MKDKEGHLKPEAAVCRLTDEELLRPWQRHRFQEQKPSKYLGIWDLQCPKIFKAKGPPPEMTELSTNQKAQWLGRLDLSLGSGHKSDRGYRAVLAATILRLYMGN